MKSETEKDPMLETDHLDELLEAPASAQPVVVVEYRSRGVPPWVFFPLIIVVPLAAIVVYHRTVVERYRVQAAQADSLLVRKIEAERASQPIMRTDPPATTVLPVAQEGSAVVSPPTPVVAPPAAVVASSPSAAAPEPALSPSEADPFLTLMNPPPANAKTDGPEKPKDATLPSPSQVLATGAAGGVAAPASGERPVVAAAVSPDSPPANLEKTPRITMRSILPNPFAEGADSPRPPAPAAPGGPAQDIGTRVRTAADRPPALAGQPVHDEPAGQGPQATSEPSPAPAAAPAVGQQVAANTALPLPTKEESERQIQEEAARRKAEIRAQNDFKSDEVRTQRLTEQLKFRDELAELIRSQGKKAGPDIEALAKRYGYETDPERMYQANRIWRFSQKKQAEKVRLVRALELPEAVVFGYLFDDIYPTLGGRNGPRSEGEVRVLAAQQLLRYPLTKTSGARPAARTVGAAGPARSSAAGKNFASAPP